jgi:hypothetical protein
MNRPSEPSVTDIGEPECAQFHKLIQDVLDGSVTADHLECTAHAKECVLCGERSRAARLLLSVFATPAPVVPAPASFSDSILNTIRIDRQRRFQRRVFASIGGLAIAASIALLLWFNWTGTTPEPQQQFVELTPTPLVALPQPIRVEDELARAGNTFRESTRPITEPASTMPNAFAALANAIFTPALQPAVANLEPARKSLADIPEAAKIGFEPVTGTAQKAFHRFVRDVSVVKPSS